MEPVKIFLKSGKEKSVKRRHLWIFSGAISKIEGKPDEGDIVSVFDFENNFLAKGHYQSDSITIRILTFENIEINTNFWNEKLSDAINQRKICSLYDLKDTNVFRLVNGEGDLLSGLIIDFYNGVAVMQCHSIGMYKNRIEIAKELKKIMGNKLTAVYDKSAYTLPRKINEKPVNQFLIGESPEEIEIIENNYKFIINIATGQKTGFFIDQRENRNLIKKYSKNRTILNMFAYTGGFSVYALGSGALYVDSIDSSSKGMEITDKNIRLNNFTNNHKSITSDVNKYFDKINETNKKYDLIILDPPAFAKHKKDLNHALKAYKKLNEKAIRIIEKKGIIFTFSCSQVVSKNDFRKAIFVAAATTGRKVKILHQLSQPQDHPISVYHPEGEYLKGLVLLVD